MTPAKYQRVKELFADAVALPEAERDSFVASHCDGDVEIREEVLSLLRHHTEKSLIETVALAPPLLEKTIDGRSTERRSAEGLARAELAARRDPVAQLDPQMGVGGPSELSRRFEDSTLRLLKSRLVSAIGLIFVIGLTITVVGVLAETITWGTVSTRASVFAVLGAVLYILRSGRPLSTRRVRGLELLVVAAALWELMSILVVNTDRALIEGEPETIPVLRAMVSMAVAIHIAIYGILIPANWRRTAMVTTIAALMPTVVVTIHQWMDDRLHVIEPMHYANPILTLLMAMVATTGAHIVHRVRREAEAARLYGQYQLTEEIGRGGMGVVYRAEHQMLKRPAAIKLIRREAASDDSAVKRFEEEVQISATLSHWNTVQIYDYGTTAAGDFYYVMEYLRGEPLSDRLARVKSLSVAATISIVTQTCDGLAEAHRRGMIHRDIKPSNLFLAEIGGEIDVIKIVDFGLATTRATTAQGAATQICGTPRYMSPEQIRGDDLDGRSDLYAIGCVAVECLTGSAPFTASSMSVLLSEHLWKVPRIESVSQADERLAGVLLRCLEKDREQRFATVTELKSALTELL